ncbi:hypothetical protein BCR32DRAFT_292810 [Anaeromyces robustus]|uniref:CCZ1/INTU/HSP4 first Longin domain-containing protein n=1 Tax=Anaeromyces robustus TaxID=1754192 RepID=A0A1Y1X8Y4_9FUNG|nr:hypothetical protein BCR32DRAFT_292810 [Anaeromyces robustus]|eukprot:ORX82179.1 hypothetical protein BCR32DRAFT_292810 [Anaeromyces robustus]
MSNNNSYNIIDSIAIFNQKLNQSNSENIENEKKEIIYYYPNEVPIVDQIKNIGLAKAIIKFTNTFQLKDTNSNIHSLKFRQILIQPEKDFWISMKINLEKFQQLKNSQNSQENVEFINKQLNDTFLESKLNMLYLKFKIFNDSFTNILKDDSINTLKEKTKIYFDSCIPNIKFDNIDLLSTVTGLNMISLNRDIEVEIEDFIDKLHKNFQFTSGSLIFWKNNVIYNDMDFNYLKDLSVLYDILIDSNLSNIPLIKINPLQKDKPIIKLSYTSTSLSQVQPTTQNKNTAFLLQSIKNLNIFSSKDYNQNTGFLTGLLSLSNGRNDKVENTNAVTPSSFPSSPNSMRSLTRKKEEKEKITINNKENQNDNNENGNKNELFNNNDNDNDNLLNKDIINEVYLIKNNKDILPQIVYLGDNCEPYYLIIYKYLEDITALFFIKVNNTQEYEDTYISLSKLSKSKESITSFNSINTKEDYVSFIEEKLKSREFYYSLEATIRSDLDNIIIHINPLVENQNNIIDDQYKYIIFKHSKMLIKTSKGYQKSPNISKVLGQYILDLYDDIEKKQDCTELCIRSNSSYWIAIKRIDQCDYILILPRNGFKQLTEIDDEFNKIIASFQQQQHDSIIN